MNILLAGSSVEDFIHNGENTINQPGGLFYSASAVDALREEGESFFLLTNMSESQKHLYYPLYNGFETKFVNSVDKLPVIHLTIKEHGERAEKYENLTEKISFDLSSLSEIKFDGILVNLITGYDLEADDLKLLKESLKAPIFLDIHSLSRPINEDGGREFAKIKGIENWLSSVDILQANETEIRCCGDEEVEDLIASNILNLGVKIVLVTKGDLGVRMYYLINNEVNSIFVKAIPVKTVNKVGCGDLFGAAFFLTYLRTNDPIKALYFANVAGAAVSTYKTIDLIKNLKEDIDSFLYEK
jgi:sugar/nucleoside kinase (ribokinase family)